MVTKPSPCSHKLINKAEGGVAGDKRKTKTSMSGVVGEQIKRKREGRWELGAVSSVT